MTLKEFRAWFVGFCDAIPAKGGLTPDQWVRVRQVIDCIEDPMMIDKALPPKNWEPCKTVPLGSTQTFDPSVVYSNGAVSSSSTGSK